MTRLLHLVRILAALLTFGAAAAYVLWTWYPQHLERWSARVVSHHKYAYSSKIVEARKLVRKEPEKAARLLVPLAEKLSAYRREDTRFPNARVVSLLRAKAHTQLGEHEEALAALDLYLEHAPMDLMVAVEAVNALLASPGEGHQALARERAKRLFDWIPSIPALARTHVDLLASDGETAELRLALALHLEMANSASSAYQNHLKRWEVYWGETKRFHGGAKASAMPDVTDNRLSFEVDVPPGQVFLRLDPPLYCLMDLESPMFLVDLEGAVHELSFSPDSRRSEMDLHAFGLSSEGGYNPWIELELPESLAGKPLKVTFEANLTLLPAWLRKHLSGVVGRQLLEDYARSGDWSRYNLVRGAWLNERRMQPVQWIGPTGTEDAYLDIDGAQLRFGKDWAISGDVEELKVLLPAGVGDLILLDECVVQVSGAAPSQFMGEGSASYQWKGVQWSEGKGIVTEEGPSLTWRPEGPVSGNVEWNIRGVMQ